MERTNIRTIYRLEGVINGVTFNGDVTKHDDGRVNINGSFIDPETNNSAYGSYSESADGNVNYNYSGNREVVEVAKVALPLLVEQERDFVATL